MIPETDSCKGTARQLNNVAYNYFNVNNYIEKPIFYIIFPPWVNLKQCNNSC